MFKKKDIFVVVVFFNKFICFLLCKFLLMWVNGIGYDFVIFVVCVYFYLFVNWFYYFFFIGKFLSLFFFFEYLLLVKV